MPAHKLPWRIGEIIAMLKSAKTKNERAKILKDNDSLPLQTILRLNFDSKINFDLPKGFPPGYKASAKPDGFSNVTLKVAIKGFYMFVKTSSPTLRQPKRETLFLQLLEQLDNQEAKVLVNAKDKKLDAGLTRKLVDEVFPGLLSTEVKSEKEVGTSGETNGTPGTD
jgi:hypothetical protein